MGFFSKIKSGLKKTRDSMTGMIDSMLKSFTKIDEELFEELEEILIMGDVGASTAHNITDQLRERVKKTGAKDSEQVRVLLKEIITEMLSGGEELKISTVPSVILIIGVNGVGKTTSIGKLSAMLKSQGKRVLIGACDTFRAAAVEQLEVWVQRAGITDFVKHEEGSDPAAVAFDSVVAGKSRGCDVIICDTAGRLHNKKNLMNELTKINKVIDRELPDSDKEVLLVLDATTGQNAVIQAREFRETAGITGIILTKLDGTAKGGVVISIMESLGIPVKYIGVGEQLDDLQKFDAKAFTDALFD